MARSPTVYLAWQAKANLLGHLDRLEEARDALRTVKSIVPTWIFELYEKGVRIGWRNKDEVVEALTGGLRKVVMQDVD